MIITYKYQAFLDEKEEDTQEKNTRTQERRLENIYQSWEFAKTISFSEFLARIHYNLLVIRLIVYHELKF